MPEGPSIVILKGEVKQFKGQVIEEIGGNTKEDLTGIAGKKIKDFKSWGKHFIIEFADEFLRIHFLLFGSYSINEKKDRLARLSLRFSNGYIIFYTCSVKRYPGKPADYYDFTADVMNPKWDAAKAKKKLKEKPAMLVADALLDQEIFAGVGNIIKNEVLFRIKVHPQSKTGKLPPRQLNALLREARQYSFDFLKWKKAYVLRKHWLAHTKTICPRCEIRMQKKYIGKTKRRTFFCTNCQIKYDK